MRPEEEEAPPLERAVGRAFAALASALITSGALTRQQLDPAFAAEIMQGDNGSELERQMLRGIWETICFHLDETTAED